MGKEDFIQYKPKEVSVRKLPKHFNNNDRKFIERLIKENYREGFLNGLKFIAPMLLFFVNSYSQTSINSGGDANITIGEVFPIMRTDIKPKEVSLGIPKFETTIDLPKPIVEKKKSLWQKILLIIKKLFK